MSINLLDERRFFHRHRRSTSARYCRFTPRRGYLTMYPWREQWCPGALAPGHHSQHISTHTSKGVEITMPPVSIWPAMSDRPNFRSEDSIGV